MKQYENSDRVMEPETILKNGARKKSQISKGSLFNRTIIITAILFFTIGSINSCKTDKTDEYSFIEDYYMNPSILSLNIGTSEMINVNSTSTMTWNGDIYWNWSSSNPSVAVNENDINSPNWQWITAVGKGTATITCTLSLVNGTVLKTLSCEVTVSESDTVSDSDIAVTSISIDKTTLTLAKGQTTILTATVKPDNSTNKSVNWTSSDSWKVTVDNNGKVTARDVGEATITAKAGDKTATCTVTVPTMWLDKYELELIVGEEQTLNATTTPSGQSVVWSSSNTSKVTVEGNYGVAKIIAKTSGTANINATYGGQMVSCKVTVYDCFSQEYVTFDGVKWAIRNVDKPGTFAAKATDAGMFYQWNRKIGWSSKDPLVNSNGGTQWDESVPTGNSWEATNDPCPTGWRIPTYEEANKLSVVLSRADATVNGVRGVKIGVADTTVFLPSAGYRAAGGGVLWDIWGAGFFWTATEDGAVNAYGFGTTWNSVGSTQRRFAHSVRCVKK